MSGTTALPRLTVALAERYRVEREIGAGGMATVYLTHDLKHDRRVALEVLKLRDALRATPPPFHGDPAHAGRARSTR